MPDYQMTFNKLKFVSECNCLSDAIIDTESQFGRVTSTDNLKDKDFRSKFEKSGKDIEGNCKKKCSHRGISLSIVNDESISDVISIFKELFPISPRYKRFINIISFTEKAGLVKRTQSKNNKHHWDLYKCDTFSLQEINLIESISLADV